MTRYGSIYIITNRLNGMRYIGQTVGTVENRFSNHLCEKRDDSFLHNAMRKYGRDNFSVSEVAVCFDLDGLNKCEELLIQQFNTFWPNGYNLRNGGGQNGYWSEEVKMKISKSKTGKKSKRIYSPLESKQRFQISRTLGGKYILGTEIFTGRKIIFLSAHETAQYGFEPWNVVSICKGRRGRKTCHGYTFEYLTEDKLIRGEGQDSKTDQPQRIESESA